MTKKFYYGDNLSILREHIADESVDLIYLERIRASTDWALSKYPKARPRKCCFK